MTSSEGGSQLDRPFEGGFEATSGISMVISCHVCYPLALDQAHTQTKAILADYIG